MRLFALAALVAVAVAPASAQSLGEIAAREKARREKEAGKRPAAKVITEDELRGRRTAGTVSQPAAYEVAATASSEQAGTAAPGANPANPAGGPAAPPQKTEDELRAEQQAQWRQKLLDAQANVASLRTRQEQIQAELNDTRSIYGPNRASLVGHLEKTKTALAQAEQTVANLEEEGRRNRYR
jgi:hypothetical protein